MFMAFKFAQLIHCNHQGADNGVKGNRSMSSVIFLIARAVLSTPVSRGIAGCPVVIVFVVDNFQNFRMNLKTPLSLWCPRVWIVRGDPKHLV